MRRVLLVTCHSRVESQSIEHEPALALSGQQGPAWQIEIPKEKTSINLFVSIYRCRILH
jgi:hypothetical protein